MNKIKLNSFLIKKIANDLNEKISNNHISNVTVVNSTTIIMQFSFYRKARLLISLEKNQPYIALLENLESIPTIDAGFSMQLRHHLKDCYIVKVEQANNDAILHFYLKEKIGVDTIVDKHLFIELIPLKPELIIVRENNTVVLASHYGNDKEKRQLIINDYYRYPNKEETNTDENNDVDLSDLYAYGFKIYEKALNKRKKEKFDSTLKFLKNKIKLLNRKIPVLEQEIKDGENADEYQNLGNLCYYMPLDELLISFKQAGIKYDESKSNIDNAGLCFKHYKKCKNKLKEANRQLEIALDDLDYYNHLLKQCELANEDDLAQIQAMLFPNKKLKPQERKKINNLSPYFVKVGNDTILFGKNDMQNNNLTFKVAHYKDLFLHIHSYPGSHVIIKSNKISDDTLLTAAEIALLLSKKEDGEVTYTEVKNVKKTEKIGLVTLKEEKRIFVKNIRSSTKQLLKTANRK